MQINFQASREQRCSATQVEGEHVSSHGGPATSSGSMLMELTLKLLGHTSLQEEIHCMIISDL